MGLTLLFFFPASNLVVPIGTIMGERLFYLPSAGLCLLAGVAWEEGRLWLARHPFDGVAWSAAVQIVAVVLVGVVGTAFTLRTVVRNDDWASTATLFQSALRVMPGSARVHVMVGDAARDRKDWEQALQEYLTGIKLNPSYTSTSADLNTKVGAVLLILGRAEEAIAPLERAAGLEPDLQAAHYNLGLAYARLARFEEAEMAYRRAISLNPEDPEPYNGLSYVLTKQRRYEEALAMADSAVRIKRDFVAAHFNRAKALEALGQLAAAAASYEDALNLDPAQDWVRQRVRAVRAALGPAAQPGKNPSHEEAGTARGGF
jgi:tetratricopeptide (TPR) repeat protein